MNKKVFMIFNRTMFYDSREIPIYNAGIVYEIPLNMVDRWLKRGGVIVDEPKPKVEEEELSVTHKEEQLEDCKNLNEDETDAKSKSKNKNKRK